MDFGTIEIGVGGLRVVTRACNRDGSCNRDDDGGFLSRHG